MPVLSADAWLIGSGDGLPSSAVARPLVFIEKVRGASRLASLDRRALGIGLKAGMSLADARARVPELRAVALDRVADAAFLDHLGDVALLFTPSIALEPPDGLLLDITGCSHLIGGEEQLVERLGKVLRAEGVSVVKAAVAPTPEMARALARFGRGTPIFAQDDRLVRGLSVAALECEAEDALALKRAGLRTIGDVADRPSVLFSARFTPAFTAKLARILGEEDRRITPRRPPPELQWDRKCAEPVTGQDVIARIVEELLQRAASELEERAEGGRVFDTVFFRTDGVVRNIRVETSQPMRDPKVILRLYCHRLDTLTDPLDPGFGFDLIRLRVLKAEPCAPTQASLDAHHGRQAPLAELIDRLAIRCGRRRVFSFKPVDAHTPENAEARVPPMDAGAAVGWASYGGGECRRRPLSMLPRPSPIEVHASSRDGAPLRFRWRRIEHEITRAEGPERIVPTWWGKQSALGARDYYRVETALGHGFWLFRADATSSPRAPRWFLHGIFP